MKKSILFGILLSFFAVGYASALTISGYVRDSRGTAIGGVTVYFGDGGGSAVTGKTGFYSRALPLGWYSSYGPSQAGYYFSPASYTYFRGAPTTNRDFVRYPQTYTVSGYVRDASGTGIEGVTMTFSNGEGTATTSSTGYYSTIVAYGWSGTATPSIASHTFSPTYLTFTNVTANKTNQNFTGTLRSYYISGYVRDGAGTGLSGITVTLSNSGGSATTSSSGYYYKYVNYGWSGTAAPSIASYTFSPSSLSYTNVTTNYTSQNFTGTLKTFTISGSVTTGGLPLGSTVTFSNGGGVVIVGKLGTYSRTLNYGWSGTVTPSATGYTFSPSSRTYTGLTSSYSSQNFSGTKITKYISGYVYTPTGAGMDGATVTFDNGGGTATTSSTGYYYKYLDYGWSGTVTPFNTGFTFTPASRSYTNLTSNTSGQDYTGAYVTYTVSGYVMDAKTAMQGVAVTFSNGGGAAITGKTGYYARTLNHGWNGTVMPYKAGYSFSPSSRAYTKLSAGYTDQDFDGSIITYTISGTIVDTAGDPVPGVTVTFSNTGGSDITDANGYYSEAVDYGWSGSATPSSSSHTFEPASRSYFNVTGNVSSEHYTGTIKSYRITGEIREAFLFNGNLIPGGDINSTWVHFDGLGTVFTDIYFHGWLPDNVYAKYVPHGWSGWVWPSKVGYYFYEEDSVWCENVTAPDTINFYGGIMQYAISGTLRTAAGDPVQGASIYTDDDEDNRASTNDDGVYSIHVDYNWSGYLVWDAPFLSVHGAMTPYTDVTADISGQNHTGEYEWVTVSGTVTTGSIFRPVGLAHVEIMVDAPYSLPGDTVIYSKTIGKTAYYAARVLKGVSNTFWPQLIGYRFTPSMFYGLTDTAINVWADRLGSITVSGYTMDGTTPIAGVELDFYHDYPAVTDSNGYFEHSIYMNQPYDSVTHYNGVINFQHDDYVFTPTEAIFESLYCDTLLGTFQAREKYQFPVTASAGAHGVISPDGVTYVKEMTDQLYTITPDSGYVINDVVVSDTSFGAIPAFLFNDISDTHVIAATFVPAGTLHTVTVEAFRIYDDSLGQCDSTVIPHGEIMVNNGGSVRLSFFKPYITFSAKVYVNGLPDTNHVQRISTYRYEMVLENITKDMMVWVMWMPPTPMSYYITSFATPGGTIDPQGQVLATSGGDYHYSVAPNTGYYIDNVVVDYVSKGAITEYLFEDSHGSHSIAAGFWKYSYPIVSAAGTGGTIWPDGTFEYYYGDTVTYTFAPEAGYKIDSVMLDGVNQGTPSQYTFNAVADSHEIAAYFSEVPYGIITTAGTGGSVSPAGTTAVTYFDTTTVTVTPDTGYEIAVVMINDSVVGTGAVHTFTGVLEDRSLQASFVLKEYVIVASADAGGSISPADTVTVTHGDDQAFSITPAVGYEVSDLLIDSVAVGPDTAYTFSAVSGDHTIQAQFSLLEFTVTAAAGAGGSISPSGASAVTYGDTLAFTVTPDPGYRVDMMTVDSVDVGAASAYSFEYITGNHDIAVTFRRLEYTVNASAGTGGSIAPSGDSTVLHGDTVVYVVTPAAGYDIADILVDSVSQGALDTVILAGVIADMDVEAGFVLESYNMAGIAGSGGSISPAGTTVVQYGDYLEYTITPDTGYDIAGVAVDGVPQGAVTSYAFSSIDTGHTVSASFAVQTFTVGAMAGTHGSISPAGDSVIIYGNSVTYAVTPDSGYQVADVTVDGSSQGAVTELTLAGITDNHTVVASFAIIEYEVFASAGTGGSITPAGTTVVEYGDTLTLTVTAATGYTIAGVTVDGVPQGAVPTVTLAGIITDHSVSASFTLKTFEIITAAGTGGATSPAGTTVVSYGDTLDVTVTPAVGYDVSGVNVDGTGLGALTVYSFENITADHTLAAAFSLQSFTVTASAGTGGSVNPAGGTVVNYGDTLVVAVTPDAGYDISGVLVDGVAQGALDTVVLGNITADRTVAVSFTLKTFTIITAAGSGGGVTPAGTTVVNYGDTLGISVTPAIGYDVSGITVDGTGLGALTAYSFENIRADHTLAAAFALQTFTVTAGAGTGGSISPAGAAAVNYGDTLVLTVTPSTGYDIADVLVDGISQGAGGTVRLEGITADRTVSASFVLKTFSIISAAGTGGAVSPAGTTVVNYGDTLDVSVTPATGYNISGVTVDSTGLGAITSYAFEKITADHTLAAVFTLQSFTVTASAGAGGSISPAGVTAVNYGDTLVLTVTPSTGYDIADVLVDGISQGTPGTVRLEGITAARTVSASFVRKTFSIITAAGTGGAVSPAGTTVVSYGDTLDVAVVPATGYDVSGVTVDGTGLGALTAYAFNGVTANHTLAAAFVLQSFTVTATAGSGGSISPAGVTAVNYGDTLILAVTPSAGYKIADVLVDSVSQGAVDTLTLAGITAGRAVHASFIRKVYAVYAAAGSGGSVSPAGTTAVVHGMDLTVSITADGGYAVTDVLVDGVAVGAVTGYTFNDVDTAHTLTASFSVLTVLHPVYASAGAGGSISPAGTTQVNQGNSITYTVTPADIHWQVADVLVDGVPQGAVSSYKFTGVDSAHTISATFEDSGIPREFPLYAVAGTGGTVAPAGTLSVPYGADTTVSVTPAAGYYISDVLVDGVSQGAAASYTFSSVADTHALFASFSRYRYAVVTAAGAGGSVSPAGTTLAYYGDTLAVFITPDSGYAVSAVYVDGVLQGAVASHAFNGITAGRTLSALFAPVDYVITATAGTGGSISPAGAVSATHGSDVSFTVTPATGYVIADVLVDGASVGAAGSHTFTAVAGDHAIHASFALQSFTITATAGAGGSVSPAGATVTYYGDTLTVAVTPDSGYAVSAVYVDGVPQGAVTSYAFNGITGGHSLSALFAPVDYVITATAGAGGSISPAGAVNASHGSDVSFTVTPDAGYAVADVLVDSVSVGAVPAYTFSAVSGNHAVHASFALQSFVITASAGAGGTVSPAGSSAVTYGDTLTVSITPDSGYAVSAVYVNGVSVGAVSSYRFAGITGNRTLSALFAKSDYVITATAGSGGSISPAGAVSVTHGADRTFTVTPAIGYAVAGVLVDGVPVGAVGTYTFSGVTASHTITASFSLKTWRVTAVAGLGGFVSPAGTSIVNHGDSLTVSVTPLTGYAVSAVYAGGVNVGAVTSHTFSDIDGNRSLTAVFTRLTYPVTVTAGPYGTAVPAGTLRVAHGDSLAVSLAPNTGFETSMLVVDGDTLAGAGSYVFTGVTAGHTLYAAFRERFYTVTAAAGAGGSISPSGDISVPHGAVLPFSIVPGTGYRISTVLVDSVSHGAVASYTFGSVTADHRIDVSFALKTYNITASAGAGGSITPAGTQAVNHGDSLAYVITPDSGYYIAAVTVDGIMQGTDGTLVLADIDTGHTVAVVFERLRFLVEAVAGAGGSVSPAGSVWVYLNGDQPFTFIPDAGYAVAQVLLDGVDRGAVASLTLENVDSAHTLTVSFVLRRYLVRALAGNGGAISPAGSLYYDHGSDITFSIVPDSGFMVEKVFVDGMDMGADTAYSFTGLNAGHVITAMFVPVTVGIAPHVAVNGIPVMQAVPNPCRGSGEILIQVTEPDVLELKLLDRDGNTMWSVPARAYGAGRYRYAWHGGEPGVYLLQLAGRNSSVTVKVLVAE